MDRKIRFRTGLLLVLIAGVMVFYCVRLYKLQMVDSAESTNATEETFTYYSTVTAARGEILDVDGNTLVSNRTSYNLSLLYYSIFNADDPNGCLQALVERCAELEVPLTDHLPVSTERPYQYTTDSLSSAYGDYFTSWLEQRKLDPDMSAEQLVRTLRDLYNLPEDLDDATTRSLVGVRYELDLRRYNDNLDNYVIAYDVPTESLAALLELSIPGLSVETSTERVYHTEYCAHILGTVGLMTAEEYEYYKELGYPMNAVVGKDGLERAFEEYLHGKDGRLKTTVNADGEILEQVFVVDPEPGDNVQLTIDLELQATAEDALEQTILKLREEGVGSNAEGKDAEGGAVVVMEVNTGKVLACGSYPTFDLSTYTEDFTELSQDSSAPLLNRALLATYPPGSVFKMVTTIAAIDIGGRGRYWQITDEGVYTYYENTPLRCYYYKNTGLTHGSINVMEALAVSCNYYFYEVGRIIGWEPIDQVAQALGLGEQTGVELAEYIGSRANPDSKAEAFKDDPTQSDWYGADTLTAAIGQSENRYTPMQLCAYTCALATGGTRYKATFLDRILSSDDAQILYENSPVVASTLDISEEALAAVREGMEMAASSYSGTAYSYLHDYPIKVACKTGTAEHGSSGSDHASFVLYAPADDPQIAIAVYVEKGAQGGNLSNVAKAIMDVYFSRTEGAVEDTPENGLG